MGQAPAAGAAQRGRLLQACHHRRALHRRCRQRRAVGGLCQAGRSLRAQRGLRRGLRRAAAEDRLRDRRRLAIRVPVQPESERPVAPRGSRGSREGYSGRLIPGVAVQLRRHIVNDQYDLWGAASHPSPTHAISSNWGPLALSVLAAPVQVPQVPGADSAVDHHHQVRWVSDNGSQKPILDGNPHILTDVCAWL